MNAVAAWLVGGWGTLSAYGLAALALVPTLRGSTGRMGRAGPTLALLCSLLVQATGEPLTPWYAASLSAILLALAVLRGLAQVGRCRGAVAPVGRIAVALALLGIGMEAATWRFPAARPRPAALMVVGDSLSAGIGRERDPWPELLGKALGVPVDNRARPGARVGVWRELLPAEIAPETSVLVLLGGNDMLSGGNAADYEPELDALIAAIFQRGGRPVLLQFPALPGRGAFPAAVANVAQRHTVPLVHRRLLASVFGISGSTVDGLHLSDRGHAALAAKLVPLYARDAGP